MSPIKPPRPVLLLMAVTSRYDEAIEWARQKAADYFGPVALTSPAFAFRETDYYARSMGTDLKKQFLAFQQLIDPAQIAQIKRQTNAWEEAYQQIGQQPQQRPLNLDPGYVNEGKLVLASTKDHAHRIYLEGGIYAEVTLQYRHRAWRPAPWTYPDYRRGDYHVFFSECRSFLRSQLHGEPPPCEPG